jgi:hypothetical protein
VLVTSDRENLCGAHVSRCLDHRPDASFLRTPRAEPARCRTEGSRTELRATRRADRTARSQLPPARRLSRQLGGSLTVPDPYSISLQHGRSAGTEGDHPRRAATGSAAAVDWGRAPRALDRSVVGALGRGC